MDENDGTHGMVTDAITKNSHALELELFWFSQILNQRISLHFEDEANILDINNIAAPDLSNDESTYAKFITHYEMSIKERLLFLIGLVPHIRPQLFDVFFVKNESTDREFSEFGGLVNGQKRQFQPTVETALFIMCGSQLEERFSVSQLFEPDHFFTTHQIMSIEQSDDQQLGLIELSKEILDLVTTGVASKPRFGSNFPAKRLQTDLVWSDLVLNPYTNEQINEIRLWIEHGSTLLDNYKLKKIIKPGYRSLFYGPSGTGKTLTASLLGQLMDQEVYRIDLSMVVSKYIGETEKNLEKVFHQAEYKNWILFFDEADSLFGKRTSINDARDKFANQEVSYLLQRIEDFPGVIILASNLKANLDAAFTRRFQSIIHFPMPNKSDRLRLWKNSFSTETQFSDDVDWDTISNRYEMTGGMIINVVRYATLMSIKEQTTIIKHKFIIDGIRKEFLKDGRTI